MDTLSYNSGYLEGVRYLQNVVRGAMNLTVDRLDRDDDPRETGARHLRAIVTDTMQGTAHTVEQLILGPHLIGKDE